MSRAVTVGLGQRFRSQSKRISSRGEVCCRRSGLGGSSSAKENVSPLVCFGIGGFPGLLGRAAIENKFVFGGVTQIYRHDHPIGVRAGFLVSGVGGCAELFCLRRPCDADLLCCRGEWSQAPLGLP